MTSAREIDELTEVFNKVCDQTDWKAPIEVFTTGEGVTTIVRAIEFFTATHPKVALDVRTMKYIITSEGYRMGPAGDH